MAHTFVEQAHHASTDGTDVLFLEEVYQLGCCKVRRNQKLSLGGQTSIYYLLVKYPCAIGLKQEHEYVWIGAAFPALSDLGPDIVRLH